MLLVGAIALIGLVFWSYSRAPIFPFRTVVSDRGPNHVLNEASLKKEEKKKIIAVLDRYGEIYHETDTSVWITPRLFFDKELRWNYTSKAR